ncbi:MAG: (Fe-S)-binding protein [Candidatus Tectomicrobia bacterium]|nr:(Fe-S)-binding protein [Candidatus Tectomicrobia bacterium]
MEATREVFGNIPAGGLIYLFAVVMAVVLFYGLYKHYCFWRLGKPENRFDQIGERIHSFLVYGFGQRRVVQDRYSGLIHLLIFTGFITEMIGTTILAIQEYMTPLLGHFWKGYFYLYYSLVLDIFGILGMLGIVMAAHRRYLAKPDKLNNIFEDAIILPFFFLVFATGFVVEGFRIAITELGPHPDWALWSPGGYIFAKMAVGIGLSEGALSLLHRLSWWVHILLVFVFLGYFGWSKMDHVFFSPLNIFFRSLKPKGALQPITDFETAETFGVAKLEDFSWKQLLDVDACTSCGRCQDNCPAYISGKPLSPKKLVLDLRNYLAERGDGGEEKALIGDVILEDELWSCTTCRACMEACPVYIEHIDKIVDMRRSLVMMESRFPESAQQALRNLEQRGHPWRGTQFTRTSWMSGLDIKQMSQNGEEVDVLFWVGCTGALVDRNRETTIALAKILKAAGVNFAVLGDEESCTGDPARRLGNEYLFQMLAQQNIETLNTYKVKKILTNCPHCFNTFKNEYPQFGGNYEVVHHSEFIAELIRDGKLKLTKELNQTVTYHDSCYLGRHNDIYDAPRDILNSLPGVNVVEMKRSRNRGLCCGAGGGNAWMEVSIGRKINEIRTEDVIETKADVVSVACPFCMQMFEDGVKGKRVEDKVKPLDIIELVEKAL